MERMPPKITKKVNAITIRPVILLSMPKEAFNALEMEFACVIFPIPKEAPTVKNANTPPANIPIFLSRKACFITYIGPPRISPVSVISRYFTANMHSLNFVVNPNKAEIHIHTRAPGPPKTIAVATPAIFPVPMVAARAVAREPKDETSPAPFSFLCASFPNTKLSA